MQSDGIVARIGEHLQKAVQSSSLMDSEDTQQPSLVLDDFRTHILLQLFLYRVLLADQQGFPVN